MGILIPKSMTLKQFLDTNNIQSNQSQRSKLGILIATENDSNGKIIENLCMVKDYKDGVLEQEETISKIINHLIQPI